MLLQEVITKQGNYLLLVEGKTLGFMDIDIEIHLYCLEES